MSENHAPNDSNKHTMSSPSKISDYFSAASKPKMAPKSLPASTPSSIIDKLAAAAPPKAPIAAFKPPTVSGPKSSDAATTAKSSTSKEGGKDEKDDATSDKVSFPFPSMSFPSLHLPSHLITYLTPFRSASEGWLVGNARRASLRR